MLAALALPSLLAGAPGAQNAGRVPEPTPEAAAPRLEWDRMSGIRLELEVELPPDAALEDYVVVAAREPWSDPPRLGAGARADLRPPAEPGGRPWVLFAGGCEESVHLDVVWFLRRDGLAGARAKLSPTEPIGSSPVPLELRPLGALTVRVPSEWWDAEERSWPRVRLVPVDGGEGDARAPFEQTLSRNPLRIPWLEPGEWTAALVTPFAESAPVRVRVEPGVDVALDLTLEDDRPRGSVLVHIRYEGEVPDLPWFYLDLRSRDGVGAPYHASSFTGSDECLSLSPGFELVRKGAEAGLRIRIEGVPEGVHDLHGSAEGGFVTPGRLAVRAGDEVTLTVHRADAGAGYGFRLVPPEGGLWHGSFGGTEVLPLDEVPSFPLSDPPTWGSGVTWTAARELPDGDPVRWCVVVPGYERVYGDRGDFRPEPDGVQRAEVRLVPGWSLRVVAEDGAGRALPGVPVTLGGEPQGWTDAGGVLLLRAPSPPRDPRVAFPGWRLAGGEPDPDGRFRDERRAVLRVVLAREP